VGGEEGVHEGFEVGPPPLCQRVGDVPVGGGGGVGGGCELFVQAGLEAFEFVVPGIEVVARAGEGQYVS